MNMSAIPKMHKAISRKAKKGEETDMQLNAFTIRYKSSSIFLLESSLL